MKNKVDYSQYECPYSHIDKECGHKLHGPEGYEKTYGVWCSCGFRGPVFVLDPEELNLAQRTEKYVLQSKVPGGMYVDESWSTNIYKVYAEFFKARENQYSPNTKWRIVKRTTIDKVIYPGKAKQ